MRTITGMYSEGKGSKRFKKVPSLVPIDVPTTYLFRTKKSTYSVPRKVPRHKCGAFKIKTRRPIKIPARSGTLPPILKLLVASVLVHASGKTDLETAW
jgi:hypothetical protein